MSTANTPNRRGRPPADAEADPRQRLLEEAERLFSERGYNGTPLREVAEAAGVNPALVNYHFGGKRGLLEAVFEQALDPMAAALSSLVEQPQAPPTALLDLVQRLGAEHPHLLPLLVREALLPGGELREDFAQRFAPRLGGRVPELLRRARDRGALAPDTDPEALTLLLLSMGVFPLVAADLARRVLGMDPAGDGGERLARQVQQLLNTGVTAK